MLTLADIAVAPEQIGPQIDFAAVFGRVAPVELEIGCGKGAFLLRQARAHPERNYFGIEWASKFYRYAVDRMARWGLSNVRLLRADAKLFIMRQAPPGSLLALHVYHPDPWPKKRHHRRRLFSADFVDAAAAALQGGGRLAIQTDHAEYFGVIRELTSRHPALRPVDFVDLDFGAPGDRMDTNFEIKYRREGRAIHRLAFRKE